MIANDAITRAEQSRQAYNDYIKYLYVFDELDGGKDSNADQCGNVGGYRRRPLQLADVERSRTKRR